MSRGFSSAQPHLNIVLLGAAIGIAVGAREGWLGALAGVLLGPIAAYAVLAVLFALFYVSYRILHRKAPKAMPSSGRRSTPEPQPFEERYQILESFPPNNGIQDAIAVQRQLGRTVILRTLVDHQNLSDAQVDAFFKAYEPLKAFPNGARHVYDHIRTSTHCCVALEILEPHTLLDLPPAYPTENAAQEERRGGCAGERHASAISTLAKALHQAHKQGLIACIPDFPNNIRLDAGGKPVWEMFAPRSDQPPALDHSPDYLSPEARNGAPIDSRSDIYGLGLVFLEHLRGQGDVITAAEPQAQQKTATLPEPLAHFQPALDMMLCEDPKQRFQSAEQAAQAIDKIIRDNRYDYLPVH